MKKNARSTHLTPLLVSLCLLLGATTLSADTLTVKFYGTGSGTLPDTSPFTGVPVQFVAFVDDSQFPDFAGRLFAQPCQYIVDGQVFDVVGNTCLVSIPGAAGEAEVAGDGADGFGSRTPRLKGALAVPSWAFENPMPFPLTPATSDISVAGSDEVTGGTLTFTSLAFIEGEAFLPVPTPAVSSRLVVLLVALMGLALTVGVYYRKRVL